MSCMDGMLVTKEVFLSRRAPHMHAENVTFLTLGSRRRRAYSGIIQRYEFVGFSMVKPIELVIACMATWKQKS